MVVVVFPGICQHFFFDELILLSCQAWKINSLYFLHKIRLSLILRIIIWREYNSVSLSLFADGSSARDVSCHANRTSGILFS